jgi:myo-inositol-1(or 4)-monophosphatase
VRRIGSASLDLSYTAAGRLEGFWEYGLSIRDVAAGALIVREAGGSVSDFAGSDNWWESGDIVASNGRIHQSLLDAAGTPGGMPELERGATPALP